MDRAHRQRAEYGNAKTLIMGQLVSCDRRVTSRKGNQVHQHAVGLGDVLLPTPAGGYGLVAGVISKTETRMITWDFTSPVSVWSWWPVGLVRSLPADFNQWSRISTWHKINSTHCTSIRVCIVSLEVIILHYFFPYRVSFFSEKAGIWQNVMTIWGWGVGVGLKETPIPSNRAGVCTLTTEWGCFWAETWY